MINYFGLSLFRIGNYTFFAINGSEKLFRVKLIKHKELLNKELPKAKHIDVWTFFDKNVAVQVKIDGRMVIEYKWWFHAMVPIIGIILGILLAKLITKAFDILTIISPGSVVIAFGISVTVGIVFGYIPAKRASERDPVESIRYE